MRRGATRVVVANVVADHNLKDYDRHIATSLETFSINMYKFNRIPFLLHWPLIHNVYLKLTEHA